MHVRQVRDIEYRLLPGADRQTTDIVIERDGQISVRPPRRMTPEQVDQTVLAKRLWVYRNLADWRDLNATRVVREWVNGESCAWPIRLRTTPRGLASTPAGSRSRSWVIDGPVARQTARCSFIGSV